MNEIVSLLKHLIARVVGVKCNQIPDQEVLPTAKKIMEVYRHQKLSVSPRKPRKKVGKVRKVK